MATSPTNKTVLNILFTPMRLDGDGRVIQAPGEYAKIVRISDLEEYGGEHPDVGAMLFPIIGSIQDLINQVGA